MDKIQNFKSFSDTRDDFFVQKNQRAISKIITNIKEFIIVEIFFALKVIMPVCLKKGSLLFKVFFLLYQYYLIQTVVFYLPTKQLIKRVAKKNLDSYLEKRFIFSENNQWLSPFFFFFVLETCYEDGHSTQ